MAWNEPKYSSQQLGYNFTAGVVFGGLITVNAGDSSKYDVAFGCGVVMDYTDPDRPIPKFINWSNKIAVSTPNIALGFTNVYMDNEGEIEAISGGFFPTSYDRTHIRLQGLNHPDGATISAIGNSTTFTADYAKSLGDYINSLSPSNLGNAYSAAGANLNIDKSAGVSIKPGFNARSDRLNPSVINDPAINDTVMIYSLQDGAGGFKFGLPRSTVDPGFYDDGSGTLVAVSPNKYTIQLLCYFSPTLATIVTYGQAEYNSLSLAKLDIPYQILNINPGLPTSVCTSILVLKEGTTSLIDPANALIVPNRFMFFI